MQLNELLDLAVEKRASDIFLVPGGPVSFKLEGLLTHMEKERLSPAMTEEYIKGIYELAGRDMTRLTDEGDDDFSFAIPGLSRFRINAYRQRGSLACVIRVIAFSIPDYLDLGIPEEIMELSQLSSGMVIFTGTAGSGKSTTQACLIDRINRTRACHIITLEDPIEFLHRDVNSIVSQREVGVDTKDCLSALRSCLRQSPDVILLGEMRDPETMRTAITAAETGHLLITTLHTHGAANAIDRIIDSFPEGHQNQIRTQLSLVLNTVISQRLLPDVNGGQVPAFEVMRMTRAISSMIRENKVHQITPVIAAGKEEGMLSMDRSILELYTKGLITRETAVEFSDNPDWMMRAIQ